MDRRFRTSLNEDDMYDKQRSSKKPAHDLHFRRRNHQEDHQESSRRGYSGFTNSSSEDKSFRSSQEKRNETRSSIPTEAKSQGSKNLHELISSDASNFLHELHALPTEVFLKLVLLKLDKMEINGFAELSELAKFINKSKEVVAKSLPPDIEAVVKQMMLNKTARNPDTPVTQPVHTQVSPFDRERKDQPQGTNYSLITELLNEAKRESSTPSASATVASHQYASSNVASHQYASSSNVASNQYASSSNVASNQYVSSNVASYQNPLSYPGFSHGQVNFPYPSTYTPSSNESLSYNTPSSNIPPVHNSSSSNMTSVIPGLTLQEEQRESYSSYNTYQSGNSQLSVPKRV